MWRMGQPCDAAASPTQLRASMDYLGGPWLDRVGYTSAGGVGPQ